MVARLGNDLLRILLAPRCAACDAALDEPLRGAVCGTCWRAVSRLSPPWCVRCGDALPQFASTGTDLCPRCRHTPLCLGSIRSAGIYDGALRHIIHAFKYDGRRALAAPLAALMRDAGADVLRGATAVVPVPLSRRRAATRGFNQSDDLARLLGAPVWRVLRRKRHGPPQAGLGADARAANVADAHGLAWTGAVLARAGVRWPPSARCLRGAALVIVDDVLTTGATVEACARVLLAAGAAEVRALTAARAVTRSGPAAARAARRQP